MGINLEQDKYISRVIKKKALQLTEHHAFTKSDQEDIEQELWLALIKRLDKYNPDKSSFHTFAFEVIRSKILDMLKSLNFKSHFPNDLIIPIDENVDENESHYVARYETIDQDDFLIRTGKLSRPRNELFDLSLDLEEVIDQLPQKLKTLGKRLLSESVSEISRDTQVPRTNLYRSIEKIRMILEKYGFKEYL